MNGFFWRNTHSAAGSWFHHVLSWTDIGKQSLLHCVKVCTRRIESYCLTKTTSTCCRKQLVVTIWNRNLILFIIVLYIIILIKNILVIFNLLNCVFVFFSCRRGSVSSLTVPESWARTRPWRPLCLLLLVLALLDSPSSWCAESEVSSHPCSHSIWPIRVDIWVFHFLMLQNRA